MSTRSKGNTNKLLTLVFAVSFLVNAQAGYACDMMPDMAEQHIECCCGISHKSQPPSDHLDLEHSAPQQGGMNNMDQMCDDPHVGCCIVEVSVGMNDPPEKDRAVTASTTKAQVHKLFDHFEASTILAEVFTSYEFFPTPKNGMPAHWAEPFLKNRLPAIYKTTERYRI